MARIVVLGGTGYAGSHVAQAAVARGHQVTSFSRSAPAEGAALAGVDYRTGNVFDGAALDDLLGNADVVVSAIASRGDLAGKTRSALADLAARANAAQVRLGVVGGAGSLLVAPGGPKVVDTPGFPDEFKGEALEMDGVLTDLRASDESLDWFFVSPAGSFGAWAPGEATGVYRLGGDIILADENGNSAISGADLADAIVKEIEAPAHRRARFTVAY